MVSLLTPACVLVAAAYVLLLGLIAATFFYRRFLLRPSPIDPSYQPKVVILVPVQGLDPDLVHRAESLLALDYPDYAVVFGVTDTDDPAYDPLRRLCSVHPRRCRIELTGVSTTCSDRIHNLLACHRAAAADAEVLIVVNADVEVHPSVLRHLVSPLRDPTVGAVTGYRWLVATSPSLARTVATMTNAASAVSFWLSSNIWGGTFAIRRETFETLGVPHVWRAAASDDLTLRNVLRRHGLRVVFVSDGLGVSRQVHTWSTSWEFFVRQLIVARVYAPVLWWQMVAFYGVPMAAATYGVLGSLGLAAGWSAAPASPFALPLLVLFMAQGWLVIDGAQRAIKRRGERIPEIDWRTMPLYVVAVAVTAVQVLASTMRDWILWHGVLYRLHGPDRIDVIRPGSAWTPTVPDRSSREPGRTREVPATILAATHPRFS
jgi:cellulose synthase/poly-beta-1,6-N-acetylglucosamine synthase-like glycosyltransferase